VAWRGVAWRGAAWLAWLCGLVCLTLLAGDVGEVLTQARTVTLTQTLTPTLSTDPNPDPRPHLTHIAVRRRRQSLCARGRA
jgi:hypothetical protein